MYTKKEILELSKEYGIRPLKKWGQNFLIDKNMQKKLIGAVSPGADDIILEIGPGFGEMTFDLAVRCLKLKCVEIDKKLFVALKKTAEEKKQANIDLVNGDILETPIPGDLTKIVGNLPYYITTPILEKIIESDSKADMFIMVQKEYADRILASPGTGDYSSLTCFINYHYRPIKICRVPKQCFYPVPKIDSIFMKLEKRPKPDVYASDPKMLFTIIRAAFMHRRKMLKVSLSNGTFNIDKNTFSDILEKIHISANARPEELSLEEFAAFANALSGERSRNA